MSSYLSRLTGKSETLRWVLGIAAGGYLLQLVILFFIPDINGAADFVQLFQLPVEIGGFFKKPWTILTYWLAHPLREIFPFLINCLFVFMFGGILVSLIGEMKLRSFVIFSLLINGVLIFLISWAIVPDVTNYNDPTILYHNTHYYGLTSLVAGIITATIVTAPRYPVRLIFFGNVKIVWVGIIILALRFVFTVQFLPEMISIVVGVLIGAAHVWFLRQGKDYTAWTLYPWQREKVVAPKPRLKVVRTPASKTINPNKAKAAPVPGDPEDELDRILDKINEVGYEGLTRQEKEFLEKASQD